MAEARIQLQRARGGWVDRLRAYKVLIDGERLGEVRRGETKTFEVPPGEHEVQLRIDWCGSRPLNLQLDPGQEVQLECRSNADWWNAPLKIIFAAGNYIVLERAA